MSKPFTVTEDRSSINYKIVGFWGHDYVRITKPILGSGYRIAYASGGRLKDEVNSDLEAMKNLHAALGHAIQTVERLESE